MFKILINDEKRSKKDDTVPSHASAKLFDVALDLAEAEALNASDEEKEKLISAAKLRLGRFFVFSCNFSIITIN